MKQSNTSTGISGFSYQQQNPMRSQQADEAISEFERSKSIRVGPVAILNAAALISAGTFRHCGLQMQRLKPGDLLLLLIAAEGMLGNKPPPIPDPSPWAVLLGNIAVQDESLGNSDRARVSFDVCTWGRKMRVDIAKGCFENCILGSSCGALNPISQKIFLFVRDFVRDNEILFAGNRPASLHNLKFWQRIADSACVML